MKLFFLVASVVVLTAAEKRGMEEMVQAKGLKITVSTRQHGKVKPGASRDIAAVWIKVENVSDADVDLKSTDAYLRQSTGKVFMSLMPSEVSRIFLNSLPGMLAMGTSRNNIDIGPASESAAARNYFTPGAVPKQGYRDGLLYFHGTGEARGQKIPVKLFIPGFIEDGLAINW